METIVFELGKSSKTGDYTVVIILVIVALLIMLLFPKLRDHL